MHNTYMFRPYILAIFREYSVFGNYNYLLIYQWHTVTIIKVVSYIILYYNILYYIIYIGTSGRLQYYVVVYMGHQEMALEANTQN